MPTAGQLVGPGGQTVILMSDAGGPYALYGVDITFDSTGSGLPDNGQIYSGKYQPLEMIVMRDLFELLEKAIDRCRDAGNVVFQIVLKNS